MALSLQPFQTADAPAGQGLICPRRGCGGKFVVNLERLHEVKGSHSPPIRTAPCPYCSRVSLLPDKT